MEINKNIRNYVEWELREYHENKKQIEQYRKSIIMASPSRDGQPRGTDIAKPTEWMGATLADSMYLKRIEESVRAIEKTLKKLSAEKLKFIDLVYWKQSHTIMGAALCLHVTERTAYRWSKAIAFSLALEMGLLRKDSA